MKMRVQRKLEVIFLSRTRAGWRGCTCSLSSYKERFSTARVHRLRCAMSRSKEEKQL